MSKLLAIIDAYKDTHGQPSDASIARAVGIAPQTLSSWRKRGIKELPAMETMERLAVFMQIGYDSVLDAALIDTGYRKGTSARRAETGDESEVRGA